MPWATLLDVFGVGFAVGGIASLAVTWLQLELQMRRKGKR